MSNLKFNGDFIEESKQEPMKIEVTDQEWSDVTLALEERIF